jgi:phosphatidylserine/phosphatidylglycerophosphate/cardiolipin synthase-like enzyme
LLDDLRYAGIDQMVDDELGWKLEVADFEGNLPHSHVKTLVIDGKTAAANGFNMTYDHFPQDHPSGQGGGRFDLGLLVTGPAAQATQRMFDDMWNGADQRHCLSLAPPYGIPWQATCYDKSAAVNHVPEVLKFYLPGSESTAFSMYRSKVHDQADQQTVAVIEAAQESIEAIHVNFALDMICNLNILFNVCTVDFAPDYMDALIQAAENGADVRVLVKPGPVEGIENNVAMDALNQRLQELGVADRMEVRYFDGPVHPKALLIDEQLLIVGSQNFHYSAYGEGSGLTEYSFAVEDPQAVEAFEDVFEYEWNRAGVNEN